MDLNKQAVLLLFLPLILLFSGCEGGFYLISPFSVEGNVRFYLDGVQVGASDMEEASDWDLNDFKLVIKSSTDNIDKIDELTVFNRILSDTEIRQIYDDPGGLPDDTSMLALVADFDSSLSSETGPDGTDESGESVFEYETGIKSQALVVDENDLYLTYDSSLFSSDSKEMTLNIWFYEENDFNENFPILSLMNMNEDGDDEYITLGMEDRILSVKSDGMQQINYYTLFGFTAGFWHMATIVVDY